MSLLTVDVNGEISMGAPKGSLLILGNDYSIRTLPPERTSSTCAESCPDGWVGNGTRCTAPPSYTPPKYDDYTDICYRPYYGGTKQRPCLFVTDADPPCTYSGPLPSAISPLTPGFPDYYTDSDRLDWAKNCNVTWSACDKANVQEDVYDGYNESALINIIAKPASLPPNYQFPSLMIVKDSRIEPFNLRNLQEEWCSTPGGFPPEHPLGACNCVGDELGRFCRYYSSSDISPQGTCNGRGVIADDGTCTCKPPYVGVNCQYDKEVMCGSENPHWEKRDQTRASMLEINGHLNKKQQNITSCQWAQALDGICGGSITARPSNLTKILEFKDCKEGAGGMLTCKNCDEEMCNRSNEVCPAGNLGVAPAYDDFGRETLSGMDWAKAVFHYCDNCSPK